MKAVGVFPKERAVRLVDHPEPRLDGSGSVKLRMLEVGICGTDKEIARFEYGDPPEGQEYLVLGHESLAEVVEAGPEVEGLAAGDLAVVMVRRPCPHPECRACRAGRQDFCYTGDFTERGIKQRDGFLTEQVVDEARYVVGVPRELRDVAVLTEPLTIAEKAFAQVHDMQDRLPWQPAQERQALVLGAGPVGLLGAMKLLAAGSRTAVYSLEAEDSPKAEFVRSLGAEYVSSKDVPARSLCERLGAIHVVYEATGAAKLAFEVLAELAANAIFVFTGVPGRRHCVELDAAALMKNLVLRNQAVVGTVNAGRDAFECAVRDLGDFRTRFPGALERMITARRPLEEFESLDFEHLGGIKTVVTL